MNRGVKQSLHNATAFVGLSGGVDSATTAALLLERGARVHGVFIKGWYPPGMPCTWAADRRDAMRVAAHLGIPFHTLDASEEYRQGVIDYLVREYGQGYTPNPDIMCNREVKFGAFYRFAKEHGADYIATGHYARIIREESGDAHLARGADEAKDQSYFLWAIPKEVLPHTLFPLGEQTKPWVRSEALKRKLPVAQKRDSQGICFLGSISVHDFLRAELGESSGEARTEEGVYVGIHDGAFLHTLGERIALQGAVPGPWYVVGKHLAENILVVSREQTPKESPPFLALSEVSLLEDVPSGKVTAQLRYHGPKITGTFDKRSSRFVPDAPLPEAVAAGQSLVLYDGDTVLGGGIMR